MDKVVHFEIPADDVARAKEFYASIFDWDLTDNDMIVGQYWVTNGLLEKIRSTSRRKVPSVTSAKSR